MLAQGLAPTPAHEAPPLHMPENTALVISEETEDASGWVGAYTGLVSTTGEDVEALEMAIPTWVLELLLLNRSPQAPPLKVSFVVIPWEKKNEPVLE